MYKRGEIKSHSNLERANHDILTENRICDDYEGEDKDVEHDDY